MTDRGRFIAVLDPEEQVVTGSEIALIRGSVVNNPEWEDWRTKKNGFCTVGVYFRVTATGGGRSLGHKSVSFLAGDVSQATKDSKECGPFQ